MGGFDRGDLCLSIGAFWVLAVVADPLLRRNIQRRVIKIYLLPRDWGLKSYRMKLSQFHGSIREICEQLHLSFLYLEWQFVILEIYQPMLETENSMPKK